jgi:dermatan 4-sulfotransferase 1
VRLDEFLQYLVDPVRAKPLNEHWEQIHRLCQPCAVHYDFIGWYETMATDAVYVLHAVHADHVVSFPRRSDNYKHNRTSTYLHSAYKVIEPELLWQVYASYEDDFEFFNYQIPDGPRELMKNGEAEEYS